MIQARSIAGKSEWSWSLGIVGPSNEGVVALCISLQSERRLYDVAKAWSRSSVRFRRRPGSHAEVGINKPTLNGFKVHLFGAKPT